ncbi:RNase H domain-containing protein [Trichonephila clavipes]|nr:RNase H domain-containing protein [Trichonephila clavipes]
MVMVDTSVLVTRLMVDNDESGTVTSDLTVNLSSLSAVALGLLGNEVAVDLAKAATSNSVDSEDRMVLTSTEIYSMAKELICRTWVVPPVQPWYFQRHHGSAIFKGSRSYQTAFSRFSTGHLRCMNFEGGKRCFPICPKCNISPFSPQHILQCMGFPCEEAVASPLLFLDYAQVYGLMDLV